MELYWLRMRTWATHEYMQPGKTLVHCPFVLPTIQCRSCGEIWGHIATVPIVCPFEFRKRLFSREPGPMEGDALIELIASIASTLGISPRLLRPGNIFMPRVASDIVMTGDFMWANFPTLFFSDRAKVAFEKAGVRGVTFFPPFVTSITPGMPIETQLRSAASWLCEHDSSAKASSVWVAVIDSAMNHGYGDDEEIICSKCGLHAKSETNLMKLERIMRTFDILQAPGGPRRIIVGEKVRAIFDAYGSPEFSYRPFDDPPVFRMPQRGQP